MAKTANTNETSLTKDKRRVYRYSRKWKPMKEKDVKVGK